MTLDEFARRAVGLTSLSHADRIKYLGWYLQSQRGQSDFQVADIRDCYNSLSLDLPVNLARSVQALAEKRPPDLLKKAGGKYRLHATVRAPLDKAYGTAENTVVVERALAELPARLRKSSEAEYLAETLVCYRHLAFRAAIVMVWNLAYDHLLHWIMAEGSRLAQFNAGIGKRNPRKAHVVINVREDFEELKEDEVIDIAAAIPGVTANMKRLLKEKLGRRNIFAHPSTIQVSRPQVDDMITDLVHNIVLRLP